MVLTEKTETCEVIFTGNKKYKRVVVKDGVEWRRYKTNHQVTREQHEVLEQEYRTAFPKQFLVSLRKDDFDLDNDSSRAFLENNLTVASDNGKYLLAGVKRVKEITGWGLKESKEYVELFFERKHKYNKATTSTTKEEAKRRLEEFIKTNNGSKLACVRFVMDITGWSLLESKNFFEDYLRLEEAKRIIKKGL